MDVSGLGVSGKTGGEIDNGETVTLDFGGSVNLESFEIIVFYNGPEFGDPAEKGYLDVWFAAGGSPVTYWFQADAPPAETTLTTNLGGTHLNFSPMTEDNAGGFRFNNPFGSSNVTKLRYTAENNPNGTNNSDYALKSVTYTAGAEEQVPEPATFALMGLGLLAVGVLKRRRA
ncbi:MAG: PEP-CTERM sorting domain-containing protein [Bryobacterales bacterium]|nr:PEP-CTERM sorting domain-containing protein [Bryobacterales bacterium]